jgi:putative nucleotidyltransferase with HDIG domain
MGKDYSQADYSMALEFMMSELPAIPSVVSALLELNPDDPNFLTATHRIARQSPDLSAHLVQHAVDTIRSEAHTSGITALRHAIARLGANEVSSIAAMLSMKEAVPVTSEGDKDLWVHSIIVAVCLKRLATIMPDLQLNPEQMYTAGLLHDIGRFVAFQALPEGPSLLALKNVHTPQSLIDTETSIFGINHVDISVKVSQAWEIPEELIELIRHHHDVSLPTETGDERLLCKKICLMQIADAYGFWLINAINELGMDMLEENYRADRNFEEEEHPLYRLVNPLVEGNCSVLPRKYRAVLTLVLLRQSKSIYTEAAYVLKGLNMGIDLPIPDFDD